MRIKRSYAGALAFVIVIGWVIGCAAGAAQARDVVASAARPEAVGFSSERLMRLDAGMKAGVDHGQLAGIVTMVARHGQLAQQLVYGRQDTASGKPMQKDTIFRIYSMTKPITGVAMMILYEEGKWKPGDPIARYIPEFRDLKVYKGEKDGKPILDAPAHAPTMGELMSHTAGFTYGVFGATPVDKLYQQTNPLFGATSLQEFIDKMATLPLAYEPGEGWVYSVGVDIQGYLVEKLSGQPFPEFLQRRIFEPLGMTDTAFFVSEDKLPRLAMIYSWQAQGLAPMPRDAGVSQMPGLPSGGGGLYSTAPDYLRFAQMLLNGGELDGARILAPGTVALMTRDHVPDAVQNENGRFGIGNYRMQPGFGFGFDVAVYEDPGRLGSTVGRGTYLWDGIAGTWFWIDPANDIAFVGMIQRWMGPVPGAPNIEDLSRALTMQALTNPQK